MAARKRGRPAPTGMQELTAYFAVSHQAEKKPKVAPSEHRSPPLDKAYLSALATRYMKPQTVVLDVAVSLCASAALPFITKFQPKTEHDLLDKNLKAALKSFISAFYERREKEGAESGAQAMLLRGPSGCGKTTAVRAIAKSMHLILMEMSTKDQRHPHAVKGVIGEAAHTQKVESVSCHAAILLDDVDVVFECERGFYGTVWELVRKTKFPIIMTASSAPSDLTDKSLISQHTLSPLSETEALLKLSLITKLEKLDIPESSLPALYRYCDSNMGKALNALQLRDLSLAVGLQKPVEALETIDGRVSARSVSGNWIAENWESGFADWLDFVYSNGENRQEEDIAAESGLLDVLSLYDSFSRRVGESRCIEDWSLRVCVSSVRASVAEHQYGLGACAKAVEKVVRPQLESSKRLVVARKCPDQQRVEAKKVSPHLLKKKKQSPLPLSFLD